MRTNIIIALLSCLVASSIAASSYQLVWSDEFNGNSLDRTKWQFERTCSPQNNEMQCYTDSTKNVAVRNGSLVITALVENGGSGKKYTSGRINTKGLAAWKYGKFEARAKLPNGLYLWPALWLLPRDYKYGGWAASGEIDIMENRGGQNFEHSCALHHGGAWPKNIFTGYRASEKFDLTKDFHVYGAIWTPDAITITIDGNVFHTFTLKRSFASSVNPYTANGQPFDQPFFFLINLAIGGSFFGANSAALTTTTARNWANPQFEVDYVRAYQLSDSVNVAPAPVAPPKAPAAAPTKAGTTKAGTTKAATPATTSSGQSESDNNGGCSAGACGGKPCCNDQSNGQHCFNTSQYSCPVDGFTGKHALCPKGLSACKKACYNSNQYKCGANGVLKSL